MFLRVFANVDDPQSIALAYLPALIRIAPVRIVDPRSPMFGGELPGGWARFGRCLETPMRGQYVNVVATSPDRWTWTQRVTAPLKNRPDDPKVPTEEIEGRRELYTKDRDCVRNVLIAPLPDLADATPDAKAAWLETAQAAAKYDAVVVPIATATYPAPTYVIPAPVTDHAVFRRIVLGV